MSRNCRREVLWHPWRLGRPSRAEICFPGSAPTVPTQLLSLVFWVPTQSKEHIQVTPPACDSSAQLKLRPAVSVDVGAAVRVLSEDLCSSWHESVGPLPGVSGLCLDVISQQGSRHLDVMECLAI